MPIRRKLLIVFLCIVFIPMVFLGVLTFSIIKKDFKKKAIEKLQQINDSKALDITHLIRLRQEQAKIISGTFLVKQLRSKGVNSQEVIRNIQDHIDSIFKEIHLEPTSNYIEIDQKSTIDIIGIWDRHGVIVANTNKSLIGKMMPQEYLDGVKEQGAYFAGFKKDPLTGKNYLITLESIYDWNDGGFAGVVLLKVKAGILNKILTSRVGFGETGESYVVNKEKLMISESRFKENAILNTNINTNVIEKCSSIIFSSKSPVVPYFNYRGVSVFGAYKYLPDQEWCLITEVDEVELLAPELAMKKVFAVIGGITFFIVLFISWLIAKSISEPIIKLTDITKAIVGGDLTKDIIIYSNDEIGELASSFNYMKDQLKESIDNLEERIKEKTAELEINVNILHTEAEEHSRTEEELEKTMKGLKDIRFGINEHAIVAITDIKGKITYVNAKFCEISQYSKSELIGNDHRIINSGFHSKEFIRNIWVTIANGKVWHGEFKNKAKDGSFYWVETTIIPFKDVHGKVYQYLAIRTNISKIKIATEKLEKSHQEMISIMEDLNKEKNAVVLLSEKAQASAKAKSNFLANMSHEIRTPMNSILGFSDMLKKTQLTDKQRKYLDTVSMSGELLLGIINDILDVSKLESGKIQLEQIDFNLEDLILNVFKMIVSRMKEAPFDTYIDIKEGVPVCIKSDPTRLKQVLVNLLGNAVKFTLSGSIGVIVEQNSQCKCKEDTCCLQFTVKDTGIGIPQDKKENIFESFSQADESTTRKFGGTGLGLTISKAIVSALQGNIWVESEEGKGSSFIFNICVQKGNKKVNLLKLGDLKQKKVFIVDDNQTAREIINNCCEKIGLGVIGIADSPQTALHKLDKVISSKGIVPDLILCDIMMDGMNGYELVRKIKENKKFNNTKYIAITADLKAETSKESEENLFDFYIVKPISVKELAQGINEVFSIKQDEIEEVEENDEDKEGSCVGIKILIVEDIAVNQMLLQVYLEQFGCEGDYASNGKEAINMLKENNDYDLCLMDLQMPIMGGIEATEIIRKEISKDFPIIALTAAVMKKDQDQAEEIGMTDFLTKPIDMVKLKETILKYGRKK